MKKRILFLLASLMCAITSCMADKPIAYSEMSVEARNFIEQNFPDAKVAFVEAYYGIFGSSYEVIFNTGDEVKVTKDGEWKEIKCVSITMPEELIPANIKSYLNDNFPNIAVKKIDKDRKTIDVDLANGVEITFNLQGAVIEFDN